MTLRERDRIVQMLGTMPLPQVASETGRSPYSLAKLAEVARKSGEL